MPRYKVEWECDWDERKIRMMSREFRIFLSQARGAGLISDITPVDAVKEEPPKLPKFYCNSKPGGIPCGAKWEATVFQPCPKCGNRRFVHKGEPIEEEYATG